MINLLVLSSIIAVLLLLWFKTEVWYEYTKLVGLGFLSRHKLYQDEKLNDVTMSYIKFLRKRYYRRFLIRMLTCPICVSFWLSIIIGILVGNLLICAPIMIGGLSLYGITNRLLEI